VDSPVDPGAQHRLARQDLPAAVAAHQQQGKLGGGVVVQVAEQFDAVAGQPLRLVQDEESWALGQDLDQLVGGLVSGGVELATSE
jgi:hypothetical protein